MFELNEEFDITVVKFGNEKNAIIVTRIQMRFESTH